MVRGSLGTVFSRGETEPIHARLSDDPVRPIIACRFSRYFSACVSPFPTPAAPFALGVEQRGWWDLICRKTDLRSMLLDVEVSTSTVD